MPVSGASEFLRQSTWNISYELKYLKVFFFSIPTGEVKVGFHANLFWLVVFVVFQSYFRWLDSSPSGWWFHLPSKKITPARPFVGTRKSRLVAELLVGGGFKICVIFTPKIGEMIPQFDDIIFFKWVGKNHQLAETSSTISAIIDSTS